MVETTTTTTTTAVSGLMGSACLGLLNCLMFVYDLVTYPLYVAIQRPWRVRKAANEMRASPISSKMEEVGAADNEITFKAKSKSTKELEAFIASGISTMSECWDFAVSLNGPKACLGTRRVLEESQEIQSDGKIFKKWKMASSYEWKTFIEVDESATKFGKGLRELGMKYKERICIFAESRAEWMVSALGAFKETFTLVTLYANLGEDAIAHGVNQTEVSHLITTHDLMPKLKTVLERTPTVKCIIFFEDQINTTDRSGYKKGVNILSFSEVVSLGARSSVESSVPPKFDDSAIIMYTSGSTGIPKGVILPHESLIATVKAYHLVINDPKPDDTYLGYLPLAHVYELLSEMTMLVQGIKVGYSSPTTMIDKSTKIMKGSKGDCAVLKPTLMCTVPLVIDRIYKGIMENVSQKGPFMKALLEFCYRYKSYYRKMGMRTPIMDTLIFGSMRAIVGGSVRVVVSGGAPLLSDTHDFVCCALDVPIHQGYGLTETCSSATVMQREELTTGGVGPPCQGVYVRLVDWEEGSYRVTDKPRPRGEIVIGGKNVAHGYYKLPQKTAEDFSTDENGLRWFRTGDIGEFTEDGTLKIIDRKKDLVKLQYGEYVSLGKVETILKTCSLVENVCAYGDSNKIYCVALIVPNRVNLLVLAEKIGVTSMEFEDIRKDPKVISAVQKELSQYGRRTGLEKFEVPGAIMLCKELWTPESGLVTAAFKLKRVVIQKLYHQELTDMYKSS